MKVDINLKGVNDAINKISKFEHTKRQKVKDTIHESALNIQKGAKRRVRVDTGRLRASIAIQTLNEGLTLQVGTKVKYAPFIEFGTGKFVSIPPGVNVPEKGRQTPWLYPESKGGTPTGKMILTHGSQPHPFLFPAWDEEKPNFIKAMKEALK